MTGGLHGSNRLMGNSLLDITVFGRRAAASILKEISERKAVTLKGLTRYRAVLKTLPGFQAAEAGGKSAPGLFPEASRLKFHRAPGKLPPMAAGPEPQTPFEPPDPFARG